MLLVQVKARHDGRVDDKEPEPSTEVEPDMADEIADRIVEALSKMITDRANKAVQETFEPLSFIREEREGAALRLHADDRQGVFVLLRNLTPEGGEEGMVFSGLSVVKDGETGPIETPNLHIAPISETHLPTLFGLARALDEESAHLGPILAAITPSCRHELYVPGSFIDGASLAIVEIFTYALRVKSGAGFSSVAWSDRPWATISAFDSDVAVSIVPGEADRTSPFLAGTVTTEDLSWVDANFMTLAELYGRSEQFTFALREATNGAFAENPRLALSSIWSGLESLFGVSQEVSHRVSLYLAILLTDDPTSRREIFQSAKKLYVLRSRAVHGDRVAREKLATAARESWNLLAEALIRIVELGYVPTGVQIEDAIFGLPLRPSDEGQTGN